MSSSFAAISTFETKFGFRYQNAAWQIIKAAVKPSVKRKKAKLFRNGFVIYYTCDRRVYHVGAHAQKCSKLRVF